MPSSNHDITRLLQQISAGEEVPDRKFLLSLYGELRKLAEQQMRRERPDHTLQPTALVHELWSRLLANGDKPSWPTRGHFFKWASKAMGNLLYDHARRKSSIKSGGLAIRIELDGEEVSTSPSQDGVLDILEAIQDLTEAHEEIGQVVELRTYGGLNYTEIASLMDISEQQVYRHLVAARIWIRDRIQATPS